MNDPYNLQRFLDAQDAGNAFEQACSELRQGQKRSHWMWFIFPQLAGLGHSHLASKFAITSLDEAKAYLEHAVLGSRLRECARLVILIDKRIDHTFPYPDDLKLHSSMTLFAQAKIDDQLFSEVLRKFFDGRPDELTLSLLEKSENRS